MTKYTHLFFAIRMTISIFLISKLILDLRLELILLLLCSINIFLFTVKKTKYVLQLVNLELKINLAISNIFLKIIWAILYFLSMPLLKLWSRLFRRKNLNLISLSNFDFNSEYWCRIKE